jgi:hypothetical protein
MSEGEMHGIRDNSTPLVQVEDLSGRYVRYIARRIVCVVPPA